MRSVDFGTLVKGVVLATVAQSD